MKNVLLLCMSPISPKARMNTYLFEQQGAEGFSVNGVMTNEAPTKAVIRLLNEKKPRLRLDKVVMICSDKTGNETIKLEEGQNDVEKIECLANEDLGTQTHVDVYKKLVDHYAREMDSCYAETPIEYVSVPIPNITNEDEVSKSVIEAADVISGMDEKVELYIDFNGGQRYVAFMILAIANLMKLRSVSIKQIMTMNFDNKVNSCVSIQNMQPVFESFDLIAGISEYVNYGRIQGLKKYFSASGDKEIQHILNEMEEFSNNLQLCRTDYIMERKDSLAKLLRDYTAKEKEDSCADAYVQLFRYVAADIMKGYDGLLNGELPDIIEWCVGRDFIQQALTFCAEEMPGYFWKHGIFRASAQEQEEYNLFLDRVHKAQWNLFSALKRNYRTRHPEGSSKYAYEWMINYLPFSCQDDAYKQLLQDVPDAGKELVFTKPGSSGQAEEDADIDARIADARRETAQEIDGYYVHILSKEERDGCRATQKKQLNRAAGQTKTLVGYCKTGRVERNDVCGSLPGILLTYFLLKEQRNKANHAAAGVEAGELWPYALLCDMLRRMVRILSTD